jgi:uncharacterized membrane protein (UPF0182 family)
VSTEAVSRSSPSYVILHYVLLLSLIFGSVIALERIGGAVPLWLGLLIAILIGLLYPKLLRELDVAPEQWD